MGPWPPSRRTPCCSTPPPSTPRSSTPRPAGCCWPRSSGSSRAARRRSRTTDHERTWYADFLDFVAREKVFATLLTPAAEAAGDPDKRWDTARIAAFNEITAFYGLVYWYTWQVTILGLGPDLAERQRRRPRARRRPAGRGGDLRLRPVRARARRRHLLHRHDPHARRRRRLHARPGGKYYIGNGNQAGMVSVFGRRTDVEGPEGYVFFAADSGHERYRLVQNVVNAQSYVSQFELDEYPVTEADVLHTGKAAFDAALNTVNVGKFNLGLRLGRHLRARAVRGRHARVQPDPLRQPGHRLPARAPVPDRRVRAAGRHAHVRPTAPSTTSAPRDPTTGATCSTTRSRR